MKALPARRSFFFPARNGTQRETLARATRLTPDARSPRHTSVVDDERPPICPVCGVTMVPVALSAQRAREGEWVCLECEETAEPDGT